MSTSIHTHSILAITASFGALSCFAFADGIQFVDQTSVNFPSPNPTDYTNQISFADIDNDGDLDIAFANGGNFGSPGTPQMLRIYINNGVGIFTDETIARTGGLTFRARGVEFGDIDNDGDVDIVVANDFNALPGLLINDGAGFFTNEAHDRLPPITMSSTRGQFGDIDNDGDLDLYFTNGGAVNRFGCGQNRVYINDGNGFFTDETASRHPLGNVCEPQDAIFGDYDGDFDLDIRTGSTASDQSKLYRNNGAGIFSDASNLVPADSNCYSYDFGDINGDGLLDLLGANGGTGNSEILLLNNGHGFINVSGQINPNPSIDDNDSKFFDYDNDGDMDFIIAALFQGAEKIYNNDGAGNFTQVAGLITGINDASLDIGVADLTGDGRLDIVTAQGESGSFQNRIYINNGPIDTIPPNIVNTEQLDDTDDNTGPYVVRTVIYDSVSSDRGFYDKGITLNYTVDGGPNQQVPMMWSGNSLWRGEIPGQPRGGLVEYSVEAVDHADNVGFGKTLSFTIGGVLGDLDGDGVVNTVDLLLLFAQWGPCDDCNDCPADLDDDCSVGTSDLLVLFSNWG